ncbi:hypothetical protein [Desulfatiferula olefinivorans]
MGENDAAGAREGKRSLDNLLPDVPGAGDCRRLGHTGHDGGQSVFHTGVAGDGKRDILRCVGDRENQTGVGEFRRQKANEGIAAVDAQALVGGKVIALGQTAEGDEGKTHARLRGETVSKNDAKGGQIAQSQGAADLHHIIVSALMGFGGGGFSAPEFHFQNAVFGMITGDGDFAGRVAGACDPMVDHIPIDGPATGQTTAAINDKIAV